MEDDVKSDTPMENEDLEEPEFHLKNNEKSSVDMGSDQEVGENLENVKRSEVNVEKNDKSAGELGKNQEFSKNFKDVQRSVEEMKNNGKSTENMVNIDNEQEFGENLEINQRYEVNVDNNENSTVAMTKDHQHDQPKNYENIEKSAVNMVKVKNNGKSAVNLREK
ncbi:unnamed protein product [Mytilus coruscus]|uniref:Uncharacterized protein n=1 Tax=Mytilus coruscus TaxID=42192 RepID=A0A6J8EIX6_MYTCO|nr:unnamed protein product [Mytilus coruscus]